MKKTVIAIDTETHLIRYPDKVNPPGVCLSYAKDNMEVGLMSFKDHNTEAFLKTIFECESYTIVGHNIAFDLHVILGMYPSLWSSVWTALKGQRVHDTMIREKLYLISTRGDCEIVPCSLAALCERHLNISLEGKEDGWRFRYQELEDTPITQWPQDAIDYARDDALYTLEVYQHQENLRQGSGPGSMNTEALQVASAFSLRGMTIDGFRIDRSAVNELEDYYIADYDSVVMELMQYGIIKDTGSRDQAVLESYAAEWGVTERTESGRISTSRKHLTGLTPTKEVAAYEAYMKYSKLLKPVTTFIPQLSVDRIHPEFNVIVNTLRTSCRSSNYYKYRGERPLTKQGKPKKGAIHAVPSMNFQQIPRDGAFRKCFIPEDGNVFLTMDYSNLELICAAQQFLHMFGESSMAEVLNTGTNLHDVTGCAIYNDTHGTSITPEGFHEKVSAGDKEAKFCRQAAKPVNLGCPGGQSAGTIHRTAKEVYGLDITLEQAAGWREMARDRFPEFDKFFGNGYNKGYIERLRVHTGPYGYGVSVGGAYLANRSYTKAANALLMQTLGALGVKIAMVRLYEHCTNPDLPSPLYGCRLKALVHDEFVLECPEAHRSVCKDKMADVMLDGMLAVCPDMRVAVEAMVQHHWGKSGEEVEEYAKQKTNSSI